MKRLSDASRAERETQGAADLNPPTTMESRCYAPPLIPSSPHAQGGFVIRPSLRKRAAYPRSVLRAVCLLTSILTLPLHSATFNVRDYSAVADDRTDNTAAFSKCMDAIIAAGGGQMFLPEGVYRGRIVIPPVSKPIPSWMTIEITGESEPPVVWGTIGNFPLREQGTILKCLETSGAAVISASTAPNPLYAHFSGVHVVIRNLEVRTYNNPAISGIDLFHALQCRIENVVVNTGVYNVQSSEPTHGTKGLVTPANSNAALTILRNVLVTGYHTGVLVHEHTDGDNITLGSNIHGLDFARADHSSRFGRVCAQRCTHAVTVTGNHGFTIRQLNIEKTGPGQTDDNNLWQSTAYDLNDPKNLGFGDINQWMVLGAVGAVVDFTRNGGANIRTRRLGEISSAAPPEASGSNGGFETPSVGSGSYLEIPVGGKVGGWTHAEGSASAWIVDQDYNAPQFPASAEGRQMLQFDHRSAPHSLVYRPLGKREGDVKVSARFALRDLHAGPPLPDAEFRLLLLTGSPGNFTTLADSGKLTHTAAKTWVEHSVTAKNLAAGTELFIAIRADAFGTPTNHVFTVVDDVKTE